MKGTRKCWSGFVSPLVCVVCGGLYEASEQATECAAAHIGQEAERWTLSLSAISVLSA